MSIPAHVSLSADDLRVESSAAETPDWAPALLDALPDVVVVIDAAGVIVQRNRVAADLFGHRCPVGSDASLLFDASVDSERLGPDVRAVLAQGHTYRGIATISDLHGRTAPYTLIVHQANGATIIIARDTIAARERELLERERDATADFVRRLGHELRTPLNAVLGFAQLLELEALSPEQRADLQRILTGGRHMQALLDEVLDLSRVRSGHVDLDVASVPVLEVARSVIDLATGLADARSMQIVLDPADDNFVARADRRRLTQVLLNLVDNAVKYGREGSIIRVRLSRAASISSPSESVVRIEVADEGPGLAPEALQKLFRPFERLGAEASGVPGTGLGLVLSRALVTAMGGTLDATSRLGTGMVLTVELPTAAPRQTGQQTRRVVHVTADPSAATLVAQALRVRLGAQVEHVSDPELVPARVREVQPAVVLIDDTAPGMLSSDLVRRLAADPLTALVPTVVLCPETDPRVRLRLRAAGATSVLDVPLDVRALLDSVARHLPDGPIVS